MFLTEKLTKKKTAKKPAKGTTSLDFLKQEHDYTATSR
jgi:hypothetical protein